MLLVPLVLIAGLLAGRADGAVRIGAVAIGAGIALAAIAVGTGNWLLYYAGAALVPFGLVTLVIDWFLSTRSDSEERRSP